jgi:hypothetical protein
MKNQKKLLLRSVPRHISDRAWYYVNRASVDLVLREPGHVVRLTRTRLHAMLKELR